MQSDSGIILNSVRDILYVVFRHKVAIFFIFLLVVALTTLITFALPKVYESDASLLVRIGRENYPDDPSLEGAMVNVTQDRTAEVKSEIAILNSRMLAEQIVQEMGPGWILEDPDLPREEIAGLEFHDPTLVKQLIGQARDVAQNLLLTLQLLEPITPENKAVDTVRESLLVEAEKQTNIINVTFEHENPAVAREVLDRLIKHYLERHVDVFATPVTPEFFQERADQYQQELTTAEQDLDAFRREFGVSELAHQKETLINQISSLEGELGDATAEVDALAAMVGQLKAQLASRPRMHEVARTTGLANTASDEAKVRLSDLRLQEKEMSARYPDTHRPLIDLRAQIAQLEQELASEPTSRTEVTSQLDRNYEGLENTYLLESANLEGLRARTATLGSQIQQYRDELQRLTGLETQLSELQRRSQIAEQQYREYLDNLQQANITAALSVDRVSNVRVVQPASEPLLPVRPNKLRNVALGLLLGLIAGLAFAFILEFFDDSLNTTESVESRLGVPVLASVSEKEFRACT